ncbi:hypothetical protein FRC02_009492 [Tulasnella sp. 418]|nr:hypothetical protein FRC02_009492 [Tulasnella sp. 418]
MEKYSTWRDAGTGIQPFLTPVAPQVSSPLIPIYRPFGYISGALRTLLLLIPLSLYGVGHLISLLMTPIPVIRRGISYIFTAISTRLALAIAGIWWISVEVITKKRGRGHQEVESWNPGAGDVIVSNWASWIEILWLAFRFNPVFVIPVAAPLPEEDVQPLKSSTGRRTGTGSAAISSPSTSATRVRSKILGFRQTSILGIVAHTGRCPLWSKTGEKVESLEEIRSSIDRPLVVFPECTTSNGRGLLRFADIFDPKISLPVKPFKVFIMCIRYDPPTTFTPALTHSVPNERIPNPLGHFFTLVSSLSLAYSVSIRLLAPSDSPSSGSFMVSDYITGPTADPLGDVCGTLIAYLGKFKRMSVQGWEEKVSFFKFYRNQKI